VYLILDEVEDDDVNKEYSEETNKCAVLIGACKLITSDIVPKVNYYLLTL
jgi:cohesin complex subunit SA-1/2